MKLKMFLSIILIILNGSISQGQNFKPSKDKLYQSLIGEVHILTLFVDTQNEYWEDDEKIYYKGQLTKSQDWLVDEAANYDQELEFNNETFFVDNYETIYIEKVKRGDNPKGTISSVMDELGYDDFDHFLDRNNFDFKEQKLKLLLFVKSFDRSHAYNYFSNSDLDVSIVYCKSSYGMLTDHKVISHEVLHQFGAWDLYQGQSQTQKNAKRAKELFPNSIMINTFTNKKLEVDDLTAWRVGWHFDMDDEYMDFDPAKSRGKPTAKERSYKKTKSDGIKFDLKSLRRKKKEKSDN
ncbi:MAG: hypothetical protein AB8F94_06585 [Saprospiraceae bacterium]